MDDLKKLTVDYLRALARKHIGRGHSKLKTKMQLLAALRKWLPRSSSAKPARRAKTGTRPSRPSVAAKVTTVERPPRSAGAPRVEQQRAEPLIEGFFVARVAGPGEARRHRLTDAFLPLTASKSSADGVDLAEDGEDLRIHALARDPGTLFVFWDFPKRSWAEDARDLESPRAVLRVFQGEQLVRELDFTPESRSFYVHHLEPGQRYRVEAHYLGADRRSKQVGYSSSIVELPRSGYSEGEARFAHLRWDSDLRGGPGEGLGKAGRTLDADRARLLAAQFHSDGWARPVGASSDRRGWVVFPSASGRP